MDLTSKYAIIDGNKHVLSSLLKFGDRFRSALPYYNATKILQYSNLTSSTPILFSVKIKYKNRNEVVCILFRKNLKTNQYIFEKNNHLYKSNEPCIVYRAEAILNAPDRRNDLNLIARLLKYDPSTLILLNAAAHPQYSGEKLADYKDNPYKGLDSNNSYLASLTSQMKDELNEARIHSSNLGCSKENPSFFYIRHIFCDLIKNETKQATTLYYQNYPNDPIIDEAKIAIAV